MKVVLFEGPDKVGKTTMMMNTVDKLASGETEFGSKHKPLVLGRAFGTHSVYGHDDENKLRPFRLGLEAESVETMLEMLPEEYVIFIDRFHLSEKVYGQVFKRGWDQGQFEGIDSLLHDALLVLIQSDDPENVFNRFPDDNGRIDGLTLDEYAKSVSLFNDCYVESSIANKVCGIIRCEDTWVHPTDEIQAAILNYIME